MVKIMTASQIFNGDDITDMLQAAAFSGTETILPEGTFKISRTILLGSGCNISGSGIKGTKLVLEDGVNNNMFTNESITKGNKNIILKNLHLEGNATHQIKPVTERRLSFCNGVYLANVENSQFHDLIVENFLQTALHFRTCKNVDIRCLHAEKLGWSGISTSGTDNLKAIDFYIYNSGNDHRHSAVHLDGGNCSILKGVVKKCVGNGIMLDATFAPFSSAVVQVEASECMRGVALIGSAERQPHAVSIRDSYVFSNEIGIMISNARHAFMHSVQVENNKEVGILFQGRVGGRDSFVSKCMFCGNGVDIKEIHASGNNFFFDNQF